MNFPFSLIFQGFGLGMGSIGWLEVVDSPRFEESARHRQRGCISTGKRGESTGAVGNHREAGDKHRLEEIVESRLSGGYPPVGGGRGVAARNTDMGLKMEVDTFEDVFSREILLEAKKREVSKKTVKR